MAEETAKQLRCIMLYRLLECRNVWGEPEIVFPSDLQKEWFVSLESAKEEPEFCRRAGSWFEIKPISPCLAFWFDSKWLYIAGNFEQLHVKQKGEVISCDIRPGTISINWKGKTIEQIKKYFSCIKSESRYRKFFSVHVADESENIQDASFMADANPKTFVNLRSRPIDQYFLTPFEESTTDYYLDWEEDSPYCWGDHDEKAKELDRELAKFFPTTS